MPVRNPRLVLGALALALLLPACGGGEEAPDGEPGDPPAATSPAADSGLDSSVTVDTQATPGDTAPPAR